MDKINFDTANDELWFVGDLVNRGPDSLGALRYIKSLEPNIKVVLGNHDLHLMAHALGFKQLSPKDTLKPILAAKDCDELLHWLHQKPLIHYDQALNTAMVHAGIPPQWSVEDALRYSAEVAKVLRGKQVGKFFENMYGDKPDLWDNAIVGMPRLRLITNYLTRMRYCDKDGRLELNNKLPPQEAPPGYKPWFAHHHHRCKQERIVFGHWASLMGHTGQTHFIGVDTGCVWGGELSAFRLEDARGFSVHCDC